MLTGNEILGLHAPGSVSSGRARCGCGLANRLLARRLELNELQPWKLPFSAAWDGTA